MVLVIKNEDCVLLECFHNVNDKVTITIKNSEEFYPESFYFDRLEDVELFKQQLEETLKSVKEIISNKD